MYNFIRWILKIFVCKILYRVKYINKENEAQFKKCMICPNHTTTIEGAYFLANTKNLSIMAKAEHFEHKIKGKIFTYMGLFPIKRGQKDLKSMLHAIHIFKKDEAKLLIFPEGTRVLDKSKSEGKIGPIYIACKAQIPIVPVYITRLPKKFSRVNVIYGEPINIPKEYASDKIKLQEYADKLIKKIYSMEEMDFKLRNKTL